MLVKLSRSVRGPFEATLKPGRVESRNHGMVVPGRKKALGGTVESRNGGKSPETLKDGTAERRKISPNPERRNYKSRLRIRRQVKRETVKQNRFKRLMLESNGSAENCVPPQKKRVK